VSFSDLYLIKTLHRKVLLCETSERALGAAGQIEGVPNRTNRVRIVEYGYRVTWP